jgi:cell division protein FtsL
VRALSVARAPRRPLAGFIGLRRFLLVIAAVAAVAALFLLLTANRVAYLKLGQRVGEMERREAALIVERKELELARARLTSPDRLERYAREQLGMVNLQPGQFQVIR